MNGAKTLPWLKTIREPKILIIIKAGSNQSFFLTIRNFNNSIIKDI